MCYEKVGSFVFNRLICQTVCVIGLIVSSLCQAIEVYEPDNAARSPAEVTVRHESGELEVLEVEQVGDKYVFEGDIVVGSVPEPGKVTPKGAGVTEFLRWDRGVIPYVIESGHPNTTDIQQAIWWINNETVLWFRTTANVGRDYVYIRSGSGCSSGIGRPVIGDAQVVTIGSGCGVGNIVHELLHAAGLLHEQSRSDRDNYVQIHWQNILDGRENDFKKHDSFFLKDISSYDFDSIMHYGSTHFSKDGTSPTITTTSGGLIVAQRNHLSAGDINVIRKMYTDAPHPDKNPVKPPPSLCPSGQKCCEFQDDGQCSMCIPKRAMCP